MIKTSSTHQWVNEKSSHGAITRSLSVSDIFRWDENISEKDSGSSLEPAAATGVMNPTIPKTNIPTIKIPIPRIKKTDSYAKGNYILLKKYNGFVSFKDKESFTARLYESGSEYPVLEAEFDLEELAVGDRELVVEGAALVWTIGYHDVESRKRESLIYMRRRPGWNQKEIEQAKLATEELTRDIHWK